MSTYLERLAAKGISLDTKPMTTVEKYNLEQQKAQSLRTGGKDKEIKGGKKKARSKSKTKKVKSKTKKIKKDKSKSKKN